MREGHGRVRQIKRERRGGTRLELEGETHTQEGVGKTELKEVRGERKMLTRREGSGEWRAMQRQMGRG